MLGQHGMEITSSQCIPEALDKLEKKRSITSNGSGIVSFKCSFTRRQLDFKVESGTRSSSSLSTTRSSVCMQIIFYLLVGSLLFSRCSRYLPCLDNVLLSSPLHGNLHLSLTLSFHALRDTEPFSGGHL
ncbi:hypothetical protein KP509_28G035600 [Ceratopteris richardii]|uniref:Uncharacterized protein n=1 Tax=Ceratopteris richardii TaxID=49495 RepID=A0A8T2RB53_CERRI|nr:hypothetical protein KP509_28G035600 [Ceratopteris richardii]